MASKKKVSDIEQMNALLLYIEDDIQYSIFCLAITEMKRILIRSSKNKKGAN